MSRKLNNLKKLPESELQIMQIIWDMTADETLDSSHVTASEMFVRYPERIGHLKLTTVLTLITRLVAKGYIRSEKKGRAYNYVPIVDEMEYKQLAAADFISTVYRDNTMSLISALWNDGRLTGEDIQEIKRMIEGQEKT